MSSFCMPVTHTNWSCSGSYGADITAEKLKDFHRRRLQVLASAGPDLIAFEAIPNQMEAQVLCKSELHVNELKHDGLRNKGLNCSCACLVLKLIPFSYRHWLSFWRKRKSRSLPGSASAPWTVRTCALGRVLRTALRSSTRARRWPL